MKNKERYSRSFDTILNSCMELKTEKQHRYKRGPDPLSAFTEAASKANIPIPNLIFARIVDKEGRLSNYIKSSEYDTDGMIEELMDIINYSVFMIMALERS